MAARRLLSRAGLLAFFSFRESGRDRVRLNCAMAVCIRLGRAGSMGTLDARFFGAGILNGGGSRGTIVARDEWGCAILPYTRAQVREVAEKSERSGVRTIVSGRFAERGTR